jgi:Putative DNA-binding domain
MPIDTLNNNTAATEKMMPWTNSALELLLREVIEHGIEGTKIDSKLEIEASSPDQKADLLTDITAMANSYTLVHHDHGFLIYGVRGKEIIGITKTQTDHNKLQNDIEQLLKTYIVPLPEIYVTSFVTAGTRWGVVVIPPRDNKPYMFFKDVQQCVDPKRNRRRGEWFVRRGSGNDRGLPEDLQAIMQKQTAQLLEPLRDSVRTLQVRLAKVEDQYHSALFELVQQTVTHLSHSGTDSQRPAALTEEIGQALGLDLPTRFKQRLRTPNDGLVADLLAEARSLREFLASSTSELPWNPTLQDPAANRDVLEDLERRTGPVQLALAEVMLSAKGDTFSDALLRTVKTIANELRSPSGIVLNTLGEALRYYPLGLILYTVLTCGVAARRGALLNRILALPLASYDRDRRLPITEALFQLYGARQFFNHALAHNSCEPIAQRIRQVLSDSLTKMTEDFSEPEFFFQGEFALALAHVDACIASGAPPDQRLPAPGLYVYMSEGHRPIIDLVSASSDWLQERYSNPLHEILAAFDANLSKIIDPRCFFARFPRLLPIYEKASK